jgi:hypothetical protein
LLSLSEAFSSPNINMPQLDVAGISSAFAESQRDPLQLPGAGLNLGEERTIVQQDITYAPNLIDGRDAVAFLRQHQGELLSIVSEGVRNSSQFAASIRGQEL